MVLYMIGLDARNCGAQDRREWHGTWQVRGLIELMLLSPSALCFCRHQRAPGTEPILMRGLPKIQGELEDHYEDAVWPALRL